MRCAGLADLNWPPENGARACLIGIRAGAWKTAVKMSISLQENLTFLNARTNVIDVIDSPRGCNSRTILNFSRFNPLHSSSVVKK
jgi:hypothetical protein